MRVLMLGWEFPPFISGGLGTACYGLTKALDRRAIEVIFVLPHAVSDDTTLHVKLVSPEWAAVEMSGGVGPDEVLPAPPAYAEEPATADLRNVRFLHLPVTVSAAYARPESSQVGARRDDSDPARAGIHPPSHEQSPADRDQPGAHGRSQAHNHETDGDMSGYAGDLLGQVLRYARFCAAAAKSESFDVIHAHDWLTYPAGMAVARLSGRPLVIHVHSTEFDRSGINVNQQVYDIERRGMHAAMRIITVSRLTKDTVVSRYSIDPDKVAVVYNGVDLEPTQPDRIGIEKRDQIVLYFGRITMQKGPEYFVRAAMRVLEVMKDVKFVVAGSGDRARQMIEMAARLGIGHKMLFTGFLRGRDIDRVFALADVYVMPSVSEPFGIAPLEAMGRDVPVIISKSSGVSEVLTHALKVDFWDVDDIADKIVAVLRHPPLGRTLRVHGAFEVRRLTWDGAAERCEQVYRTAAGMLVAG